MTAAPDRNTTIQLLFHNNHTGTKEITCVLFNDYRPIALTPIMMKCFERLVMQNSKTDSPTTTRSAAVDIPSKPLYGRLHLLHPLPGSTH